MDNLRESADTFESVLVDKIRQRHKDLDHWQKVKAQANHEEEMVLVDIGEMELALNVLRRLTGRPIKSKDLGSADFLRYRGQTIAQSALDIMNERNGKAGIKEIVDILIKSGKIKSNRRVAYSTVLKILSRDKRFVRIERGIYGEATRGYIDQPS